MQKSVTHLSWRCPGKFYRSESFVKVFLAMLFLFSGLFVTTNKSVAQCNSFGIDFKQAANRDLNGNPAYALGEIHWIGSILQASNSRYVEGMSTLQRLVFNNLASCGGNHVLRIKLETQKNGHHAYDFITSWDNALLATAAIAPNFGLMPSDRSDPDLHECGQEIGACSGAACTLVTGGGSVRDLPVIFSDPGNPAGPGESNLTLPGQQNTTRNVINTYQTRWGARSVRVYVGAAGFGGALGDINNQVVFVGYGGTNPNDGGDDHIFYDVKWQSTSPDVVIEYGAHIAVGVDGLDTNPSDADGLGTGYLAGFGAADINGGPYHTTVVDFQDAPGNTPHCEGNLGSLDNQLQGSQVLLIPTCNETGPNTACEGQTGLTYSSTNTNLQDATFLWSIINSNQSTQASITSGNENTAGPITVSAGSVGSYTVRFIITNGGTTSTLDDDIADTCFVTTIVGAGPTITCPSNTSTAACQTQAQVDAAFVAWLATVTGSPGITNNGGTSGPDKCGGTKTVTFTATNTCGTATCSATFTVTAPASVTLNCPSSTTVNACQTQAQVNAAFTAWLATASASGGCDLTLTNNNDGAPSRCGGTKTVTFTATSSCESPKTCSASFTVTAPASVTLTCPSSTTVGSCQTQQQVDDAFAAWLATASASGGCDLTLTNNNDGAPNRCGGTKTVTFTATSSCESPKTCSASFTVTAPASVTLNCPSNTTLPAGLTQAQVDAAFTAWLGTASASGGCDRTLSDNNNGAPPACGGSKTVTFTVTSSCEANKTCSATFSVTAPASTTLTCPANTTVASCQTQAAVDAAYTAWLATVSSTGGTLSNNSTGAPDKCGGSKTVTFTVTADCQDPKTCSATFTVTAPASVTLNCASNTTVASCQSQATVDAAYAAWLATASASGGCDRLLTNNSTGAPDKCGGSKTVIFTVTSSCESPKTCSASFTVTAPASVTLNCASNTTVASCQSQATVDAAYAAWLATASASGGCDRLLTNNSTGAPDKCGGSKTVTWTVTSSCESPKTCSASFTVTAPASVTLNCPSNTTVSACLTQAQVNDAYAAWLATASASGGCDRLLTNNSTGAPDKCGGSKTVTFTVTSSCESPKTCSASFTVTTDNTPPVFTTCPANTTAECGTTSPTFGTPVATDACGTPTIETVGEDVVQGSCPTTYTRTWKATDGCGNTSTCSQTISVPCCSSNCTYTQGYYGNDVGASCDGTTSSNNPYTTSGLIAHSLANWGGTLTIGCAGHSVVINNTPQDIACVIDVLPGMGGSGPLTVAGDFNICSLPSSYLSSQHRINNQLLSQTITLGLNLGINPPTLGNFALQANKWLVTADLVQCGSTTVKECTFNCAPDLINIGQYIWTVAYTPYHVSDCKITQALYDALTTKNVAGLYALANSALCGDALPAGVSYGDITNAVDCINKAFDGCRAFTGWFTDKPTAQSFCNLPSSSTPCPAPVTRITTQPVAEVSGLKVSAYPNPFRDKVSFVINSQVSGQATLEIYNMLGQRIQTVYNGNIVANRSQIVEYKVSKALHGGLIYTFKQGGRQITGKLLNIE